MLQTQKGLQPEAWQLSCTENHNVLSGQDHVVNPYESLGLTRDSVGFKGFITAQRTI